MDIIAGDESDLAKKVLRKSHDQSDVTVQSMSGEGIESSSVPVCPLGGTLNEWRVYIRHYIASFGGSVGTNASAKGVYSELDLKINVISSELRKATTNLQKSQIRLEMTALGRDTVILSNEYDICDIPVVPRCDGTGHGRGQNSSDQKNGRQAIF